VLYVRPDAIPPGSLISRGSFPVNHKGIYLENGWVFESTPEEGEHFSNIRRFAKGQPVHYRRLDIPVSVLWARTQMAVATRHPYNLLANNCEHAVSRLLGGRARSPQLQGWVALALLTAAIVMAAAVPNRARRRGYVYA